jgi:2-polyprenyl-6-methoxyphenol hydroxylase-like FAD-dependent oxidoreductase
VRSAPRGQRFEFHDANGDLLSSWEISEGEWQFGVTRKALHKLLLDALPADAVVCGKTCTGFEQDGSVTARFSDGSSFDAEALIGADGLRSMVRAQIHGLQRPRYAGFSVLRCLVPADGDDPLPRGVFRMFWGRGACIGMYHVAPDVVYTFGWWPDREGEHVEPGQRKQALLAAFGDFSREAPELIEGMREEEIHQTDIYHRRPLKSWGERARDARWRRRAPDDVQHGPGRLPGDRGRARARAVPRRRRRRSGRAATLRGAADPADDQVHQALLQNSLDRLVQKPRRTGSAS